MPLGYWNGEQKASFVGVEYRVERAPIETWWQNRVIGTVRQGLMISYRGETWMIDNQHGDGYFKLTTGMGSPRCGHKSLGDYTVIRKIPESEIKTEYDKEGMAEEIRLNDEWMEENFPETFKRMQALKQHIKSMQEPKA